MNAANMPQPSDPVQLDGRSARLIFVRQHFTPYGGGERILERLIAALRSRGVRTAVLGRSWPHRDGVEFIRCDPRRWPRFSREQRFARSACQRLSFERHAIIQAHDRVPCCDIFRAGDGVHAAYLQARLRAARPVARAALRLHPFHRSVLALEQTLFASKRLKAVLANSRMVADQIIRCFSYPPDRIHIVRNGIDLAHFEPAARALHRRDVRARLRTDQRRPVALFVGSGFKRKGLDAAIEALARSRTDAELWVVGSDRSPGWRQAPGARVRLIGPVKDALPFYAAADVLMLPTLYDPFPSTVLEALACGLPVVTTTGCGASELVERLDCGLVRDPLDTGGLADALEIALSLAEKPATIDTARALAANYGMDAMIDDLVAAYRRIGVWNRLS